MTQDTRISLSVTSDDPETIVRTAEHMSRTAIGLALGGTHCLVFVGPDEDDDDD